MKTRCHRQTTHLTLRRPFRNCLRGCLRGRRREPDDFVQMLTAMGRAVRAHRKLARLAPSFFDAAVVNRERENRDEQRRWMAMWEPILAKAYGVDPEPPSTAGEIPPLPSPRTQRAVDRQLAELQLWLAAAHAARERHRQRRPHALPSWTQLARLLERAFDLKKLVLGLDSKNPLPEKIAYDYEFTDLKRAYGHLMDPAPPAAAGTNAGAAPTDSQCGSPAASCAASNASPAPSAAKACPDVLVPPAAAPPPPEYHRCDAWGRWARQQRRLRKD